MCLIVFRKQGENNERHFIMPQRNTRQTKGNAAKKEQIAEKVKEIQQRQKNWMQQRDEHLKKGPDSSVAFRKEQQSTADSRNLDRRSSNGHVHSTGGTDILRIEHDSPRQLASQVSDKLNVKVKHGFGAWLQSRKHTDTSEDQDQSEALDYGEQNLPGPQGFFSNVQEDQASFSAQSSISSLQNPHRNYPLSPAEFDSLADSIAARVKKDLGIKNNSSSSLNNRHYEGAECGEEGMKRGRTFVQNVSGLEHDGEPGIGSSSVDDGAHDSVDVSSHRCPFCSSLMVINAHIPMLLVPCGHTMCKRCSSSHTSCRLCGTRVDSLTTNIMLHQIIQEYHRKNHPAVSGSRIDSTMTTVKNGTMSAPPKTTSQHCDVNYSAQLHSLRDREAALQEEVASCRQERDHFNTKVKRAEKQVKAIQREEAALQEQIQQLQDKVQGLKQHKEEYVQEHRQLQEQLKLASDKTTLVEQTLKSLGEEIDKVQFLAEGQEEVYSQRKLQQR